MASRRRTRRARAGTPLTSMILSLPATAGRLPWVLCSEAACASRHHCLAPDDGVACGLLITNPRTLCTGPACRSSASTTPMTGDKSTATSRPMVSAIATVTTSHQHVSQDRWRIFRGGKVLGRQAGRHGLDQPAADQYVNGELIGPHVRSTVDDVR